MHRRNRTLRPTARLIIASQLCLASAGCDQDQAKTPDETAAQISSNISPERSSGVTQMHASNAANAQPTIHFTDITADSGIEFTTTCGVNPSSEILEVNGGGLAFIDFDNDGDLDLFVANGATLDNPEHGPGCKLYENLGGLKFRDVTQQAKIDVHRWAMGAAVADCDGDGFDDIFICCYGPNILLHNNHDGTFSDATDRAFAQNVTPRNSSPDSLAPSLPQLPNWSTSAAFADLDNDGDLDLYVCNYLDFDVHNRPPHAQYKGIEVMAGPHGLPPQHDLVFQNQGDGTFREITEESGCDAVKPAFGLNLVIVDFDGDGKQDIVVANDSMPDFLFHNIGPVDGHAKFEEIGIISGMASNADGGNQASMGYAIADVDGNGTPDKFTTVFSSDTNALHVNVKGLEDQGLGNSEIKTGDKSPAPARLFFEDRAQQYGLSMISRAYLGWSCGFYDFDHDGDEDLFMVNGHVYPQATRESMDSEYAQPALLFERDGNRFSKVSSKVAGPWLAEKHRGRNAVFADLDGDGDIDIITAELNGPIRVLRNDLIGKATPQSSQSNWLIVELKDARPNAKNRHAFGSRLELLVKNAQGESKQTRWIFTGGGFQSSGAPYVHFGLDQSLADAQITLNITWPDGTQQRMENVKPNQHLIVSREK